MNESGLRIPISPKLFFSSFLTPLSTIAFSPLSLVCLLFSPSAPCSSSPWSSLRFQQSALPTLRRASLAYNLSTQNFLPTSTNTFLRRGTSSTGRSSRREREYASALIPCAHHTWKKLPSVRSQNESSTSLTPPQLSQCRFSNAMACYQRSNGGCPKP